MFTVDARAADPVIAVAGDIACSSTTPQTDTCRQQYTSDLLVNAGLSAVLTLGDEQYQNGALSDFTRALELEPRSAGALAGSGAARHGKGDLDGALADLTKAVEVFPGYNRACRRRGRTRAGVVGTARAEAQEEPDGEQGAARKRDDSRSPMCGGLIGPDLHVRRFNIRHLDQTRNR